MILDYYVSTDLSSETLAKEEASAKADTCDVPEGQNRIAQGFSPGDSRTTKSP
jgi:hypothetical protein